MPTVLIAGGSGFIGSAVARALSRRPDLTLRCLTRDPAAARRRFGTLYHEYVAGDVARPETLRAAVEGADVVVLPCFLHPGRHLLHDIPRLMEQAQARHPTVPLVLAERIGQHPDLGRLIADCVAQALRPVAR